MPNSTLTLQENINDIHRVLSLIGGEAELMSIKAHEKPLTRKDIAMSEYVERILKLVNYVETGPLFNLQKQIENG